MIYDHRTYTVRPGTMPKQMALYKEYGYAPQTRHLGQPVLHATTEVGNINIFVHVWAYKDVAERAEKRAAMAADPDWQLYVAKSAEAGYLVHQENKILVANEFPD